MLGLRLGVCGVCMGVSVSAWCAYGCSHACFEVDDVGIIVEIPNRQNLVRLYVRGGQATVEWVVG